MKKIYWLGLFVSCVFCALVVWASTKEEGLSSVANRLTSTNAIPPADTAHGLIGYYYNNEPHPDPWFKKLIFSRVDNIQENLRGWDNSPPDPRLDDEWFSIRWLGLYKAPETGEYQMLVYANDLCRIWINGELVLDHWDVSYCCSNQYGDKKIFLKKGHYYPIKIEYGATTGTFTFYLGWVTESGSVSGGPHNDNFYAVVPTQVSNPKIETEEGRYEDSVDVVIKAPSTPHAMVRYTLDGTDPTELSPIIFGADTTITLKSDATVKVNAVVNGMYPSATISKSYSVIPPLVSTPAFFPAEGIYGDSIQLNINTREDSTTIYYTLDGSVPDTNSLVFSNNIVLDSTTRIKALAVKQGMTPSKVASATYTFLPPAAAAPEFSIPEGTYSSPQKVSISSQTPEAVIHYALNKNVLNDASPVYSTPITIDKTTTLKAYAEKDSLRTSIATVVTYEFENTEARVDSPRFSLSPGVYNSVKRVNIFTNTKDATIYFTTDGSSPDQNSSIFFAPILIEDSLTISAFASKPGMNPSDIVSATYIVNQKRIDTGVINDQLPATRLSIAPNPAINHARISWDGLIYNKEGSYLVVTDSKGIVMKRVHIKGGITYFDLQTSTYANGVYFVKVYSGQSEVLGKLIIGR